MNKRIQQLAEQASEIDGDDLLYYHPVFAEKFAQLIVRECLDIVNRKEYSYHEADPLWETSQLIKEHFGVTE